MSGGIADLFAQAFAAAGDFSTAIQWYEMAIESNDSDVSFRAVEQLSNLRIRQAWRAVGALRNGGQQTSTRSRAAADRKLRAALEMARTLVSKEMKRLSKLSAFTATAERESLFGGAMKRLAMIEAEARRPAAEARALKAMKRHYERALEISQRNDVPNLFYPAMNVIVGDLTLNARSGKKQPLDAKLVETARKSIVAKNHDDPDFWSFAAQTDLLLYEAVAKGTLRQQGATIERGYADLFKRSQGPSVLGIGLRDRELRAVEAHQPHVGTGQGHGHSNSRRLEKARHTSRQSRTGCGPERKTVADSCCPQKSEAQEIAKRA